MATLDVEFNFLCTSYTLRATHPIPTALVDGADTAKDDSDWQQLFARTLFPIIKERHDECFENSARVCTGCEGVATHALMTPASYLHLSPPKIAVSVSPTCRSAFCDGAVRAETHLAMVENAKDAPVPSSNAATGIGSKSMACAFCNSNEKTHLCADCKAVAYCSKAHQRAHWKVHKPTCREKKQTSASGIN
ncbi:hypothetical protein AURDEDRAFT_155706 [Auricularia subglabra TFB-10046 SS5]|nr:hypothetical protein AURDEDRAFT_155706 [Auricularia subglabra TFB-10046 SS5]